MSTPQPIVTSTTEPVRRGSMLAGFGIGWLVMIVAYGAELLIVTPLSRSPPFLPLVSMPWIVAILLAIACVATGRTRTAAGIAIGLVTVLVVCVALFMLLIGQISHNFR